MERHLRKRQRSAPRMKLLCRLLPAVGDELLNSDFGLGTDGLVDKGPARVFHVLSFNEESVIEARVGLIGPWPKWAHPAATKGQRRSFVGKIV